jgi:serine/threonine protein kinase
LDSIAHYKILERVGDSRLGEVLRARDTRLGRTVAIKIPLDSQKDPAERESLLAAARAAATLSHPNIAALYEAGDDNGRVFLACEFVPGDPLDRVIAGRPLNPRRAIDLAAQIADALADAHAAEMAHGNLTADAVVVTPKGAAKILDFGFARWTRADGQAGSDLDDVRALNRLFFEMLTGKPPSGERVAPTTVNKSLPAEVDPIAMKDYELAVTLAADLRAVAAILEVRAETADKSRQVPVRRVRRSKAPWIVATIAALAVAAGALWWFVVR